MPRKKIPEMTDGGREFRIIPLDASVPFHDETRRSMNLAKRIRDLRYSKGWGPDELANRAKISRTAPYQIERGNTSKPQAGTLRRISRRWACRWRSSSTPRPCSPTRRRRSPSGARSRSIPRDDEPERRPHRIAIARRISSRSSGCSWRLPWQTGSRGSSRSRSGSCRSSPLRSRPPEASSRYVAVPGHRDAPARTGQAADHDDGVKRGAIRRR